MKEVIIVGAGPCGLSTAIELKKKGVEAVVLEKGSITNSIYHYPLSMTFFSSPDEIELSDIPFTTINEKPTRQEALKYYRTLVQYFDLSIQTFEIVREITPCHQYFQVITENRQGRHVYEAKYVVVATGYYDQPRLLNIPGEDYDHVYHYFREAHPFMGQNVVVIGGKNSAIDTALELQLAGAHVTMVYRKSSFSPRVKAWVKQLIESAIEKKRISMLWESEVEEIWIDRVRINQNGKRFEIPADAVFAMTGYTPNLSLLERAGAEIDRENHTPIYSESMETSIPGLYVAGVVITGNATGKVFIENGRHHGKIIAEHIENRKKLLSSN